MQSLIVPAALLCGIVLAAFLVNRFAPRARHNIRRLVILLGFYLLFLGVARLLAWLGEHEWEERAGVVAWTAEVFLLIQLGALFALELGLRLIRIELPRIVSDLVVGLAYFIAVLSILRESGVELAPVLAGGAIVSALIALSLQPTAGNLLGGITLQLDGSVRVGDWIMLENGKQGCVRDIRWRHTVVETRDSSAMIVPNSVLLSSTITVLGRRESAPAPYRMWVYFHVDFRFPPTRVVHVVEEGLRQSAIPNVAADPAPQCICMDFARDGRDSYALYAVRYWLTDLARDDTTSSDVRTRIWTALERAEIPFARPARTLFLNDEGGYQGRREERHRRERLGALAAVELFGHLTEKERSVLEPHLVRVLYAAGERITRQGAVAHWLYILAQGEVEVLLHVEGAAPKAVTTLSAPDFFGEMGLMTGEPRHADVIAISDVVCFRLDKPAFEGVLQSRPEIADALAELLAKRRVRLLAVRDDLDEDAKAHRERTEASRILGRIREFFGLDD